MYEVGGGGPGSEAIRYVPGLGVFAAAPGMPAALATFSTPSRPCSIPAPVNSPHPHVYSLRTPAPKHIARPPHPLPLSRHAAGLCGTAPKHRLTVPQTQTNHLAPVAPPAHADRGLCAGPDGGLPAAPDECWALPGGGAAGAHLRLQALQRWGCAKAEALRPGWGPVFARMAWQQAQCLECTLCARPASGGRACQNGVERQGIHG